MPSDTMAEQVLVIPATRLDQAGRFSGFRHFDAKFASTILDPKHFLFRPRGEVEGDPTYLQLIPYVVLRWTTEWFHYRRSGGSEVRLDARRSVGIGGHISSIDSTPGGDVYRAGMMREVREEVEIDSPFRESVVGFIFDDSTAVGAVHFGIVHLWQLEEPLVFARERGIADASFSPLRELLAERAEFETWSQLVMESIA